MGLRQVWKAPTSPYLKPGGGLRWRVWGGRQADFFATLSGHEEEGRSPEVQQRTKQVGHPAWGGDSPPTQHRGSGSGPGPPQQPLGVLTSLEVWALFCSCRKGVFGGHGMSRGESGLWDIGSVHETSEGVIHCVPGRGAVPLPIIRGYFWRLKGLEGDGQPSEHPLSFLSLLLTPHSAATEVEEEKARSPRGPLPHGIQAPETWRWAGDGGASPGAPPG